MKNIKKFLLVIIVLFLSTTGIVKAEQTDVNLTIRDGDIIVFNGAVPLEPAGIINLNDTSGIPHPIDANSVLSLINDADQLSSDFSISNLIYYDSFGSFYLKCITGTSTGEKCDNWQYAVNDTTPTLGMDKNILTGGESVYLYFGQNHKITLSSNSITTRDILTATTENYHYQDNTWIPLTGITVGITQTNPDNPFSPTEIQTAPADASGKAIFTEIPVGTYNVGIKEDFYFPTETLTVETAPVIISGGGGSGVWYSAAPTSKPIFDIKKAFEYISSQQKEDGSFGEDLYTDWIAVSLGSVENENIKINSILKLIKYFGESKGGELSLTDYERHSMALMTLGLNPYNANGVNYIEKVTASFDGKQLGDKEMINDDIFALIVLQNAGFTKDEEIIKNTMNFILSQQKEDGSWNNSVDMTSAAIQSIVPFAGENFLLRAKEYLKQNQKDDGGFGNVSATAWAIGGIVALGEKPEDWIIKNPADGGTSTPLDYLATNQDTDGGIKNTDIQSKVWETAYTISALSRKTWNQTMQKFDKPVIPTPEKIENSTSTTKIQENTDQKIIKPKIIKKVQKLTKENTTTSVVVNNNTVKGTTEIKKENWWKILVNIIFGF
ncbi:MAG: prenyltransferase/squalene oxidase repeat-containing protein [bacterium]